MKDCTSIFVILSLDIIEICLSREDSSDTEELLNVSHFLLLIYSQYLSHITEFSKFWKKWLFFVLQFAIGEKFRIDSYRNYPIINIKKLDLRNFLVNEYDIIINIPNHWCKLRIDSQIINNYILVDKDRKKEKLLLSKLKKISDPIKRERFEKSIRFLDLTFVNKRIYCVNPDINDLRLWIVNWEPVSTEELSILENKFLDSKNINLKNVSSLIEEKELLSRGWEGYRDANLEQPFGLICKNCKTIYKSNIFAKKCVICSSWLKKR